MDLVKYEADDEHMSEGAREQRLRDNIAMLFRLAPSEPLDRRIASLRHVLQHYEARQKAEATANNLFSEMPVDLKIAVANYVCEWRGVSQIMCRDGLPDDWRLPVSWAARKGGKGGTGTEYAVTFSTGEILHYPSLENGRFGFRERHAYPSDPENPYHDAYETFREEEAERIYRELHAGDYHYDRFEDEHNQW